jgi:hypothetical protein
MEQDMTPGHTVYTNKIDTRFSLAELLQPLRNLRVKYASLKSMDHYNNMEERKKENEKVEKGGVWKSQRD